ncbi:MAG: long-chain fatty acid--CoA ligase [Candidatus Omnitrophica bacterium]|nr:long-chain fatty acid--CoA ligase [Candidatus Omnitrophota bacterium]
MKESSPSTLGALLKTTALDFPRKTALRSKQNGRYLPLSWADFDREVDAVATALLERGLRQGDRVAILSENRPEWALTDLAAQRIGLATVPIYPSLSSKEIEYLLLDSQASWLAVSGSSLFQKILPIQKSLPALKGILAFDSALSLSQKEISLPVVPIREIKKTPPQPDKLRLRSEQVTPDTLASIIYTSGTTGEPKGVMLTHENFIKNVEASRKALRVGETDTHLSFLPLCHVFERMAGHYLMIALGATIAYAETMDTVPENLMEVRPTFIMGVPRFYEKIKDRVVEALDKAGPLRRSIFAWAKTVGAQKRQRLEQGLPIPASLRLRLLLADFLVYKKFRGRLGGRVRFCVSGGAPLARELAEFFCDLGVMIYEGYGLTETAPVISVNRHERYRFGTVGIPLEGVQVKIAEDGEILTRSACVMKGYYGKPAQTEEALDAEGWFYTGDLGELDKDGFLRITGRKKELIVTSGGKKISPRPIEEMIESDPYILRCVLFGEGKRFLTALIVPRKEKLVEYALSQKIAHASATDLLGDSKIYQFLEGRVAALTENLANFEKIKYFALLENDFSQAAGELTPTLKVRREVVLFKHQRLLLSFYEKGKTA